MNYFIFIFLLSFLVSCSGTKKAIEKTPGTKIKTTKQLDSIIKNESELNETPQNAEVKKEEALEGVNEELSQIPTEQFIPNHQLWNELLSKHVSDDGKVNYKSFKTEHKKLLDYIHTLNLLLSNEAFKTLNKEEQLAFWINAYNAMTVDLILRHYPVNSIKDIKSPWKQRHWKLNNKWYNLDEIEHKIIRRMGEPRIHFALVCAAVSCPKLYNKAFTANTLESDLTKLTKVFLADNSKNIITENDLKLSKIFKWFEKDFTKNGSLIDFLNQYSDVKISAKAKKSFKDYNWGLNE